MEDSPERVYYLAKSPADELIYVCVSGNSKRYYEATRRVLVNEHDRFDHIDSISLHLFHEKELR